MNHRICTGFSWETFLQNEKSSSPSDVHSFEKHNVEQPKHQTNNLIVFYLHCLDMVLAVESEQTGAL